MHRARVGAMRRWPVTAALVACALLSASLESRAEAARSDDVAAVQGCLASPRGKELGGEPCIGVVADPCLDRARSTAESNACAEREFVVWDAMLNDVYRRLVERLDGEQRVKARDMQRAWIGSRDKTCAFYWDYFQGTMASPMSSYCTVRETARRVMFLKYFLDQSEQR